MWRSALANFSSAATQRTAAPLGAAATRTPKAKSLKIVSSSSHAPTGQFSSNAELLQTAEEDLAFVVNQAQLRSALQRTSRIQRNPLVSSTQQATPSEALQNVAALLAAGKVDDVAQIVTTWTASSATHLSLRQRVRITKRLGRSIASLAQLRDATTLRAFLTVLASADVTTSPAQAGTLFAELGKKRVQLVKLQATSALCRLTEADGVSLMEKLYWIEQCASPTTVLGKEQLLVPFSLYTILREITESDAQGTDDRNDDALQQLAPELLASAVSPFQADVASLIDLPHSELVKMRRSAESASPLASVSITSVSVSPAAARLLQRAAATSTPLQVQERNAALVRAMTSRRTSPQSPPATSLLPCDAAARRELVKAIRGRQRPARHGAGTQDVCRRIVANPQLMTAMNLSPTVVLSSYLRAFYSVGTVNPVVAKTSASVVPRLCARHLYETAAYVSWNHLSTSCESVHRVFGKNPRLLDLCTGSVCRVMQRNIKNGTGSKWMGHRSLALLRAASKAMPVTPMHCIPVCASAIDVGVHFASVQEAVSDIFADDKGTAEWTLDMIRLCTSAGDNDKCTVQRSASATGMSELVKALVRNARLRMGAKRGARQADVSISIPSRSKQLALWQTVRAPTLNPVLKSLTLSVFTNETARSRLVDGTLLLSDEIASDSTPMDVQSEKPLEQLMTWEVLASIATNCTSEALYSEMVDSLTNRHMSVNENFVTGQSRSHCLGDEEKMLKLLQSELDEERRGNRLHPAA